MKDHQFFSDIRFLNIDSRETSEKPHTVFYAASASTVRLHKQQVLTSRNNWKIWHYVSHFVKIQDLVRIENFRVHADNRWNLNRTIRNCNNDEPWPFVQKNYLGNGNNGGEARQGGTLSPAELNKRPELQDLVVKNTQWVQLEFSARVNGGVRFTTQLFAPFFRWEPEGFKIIFPSIGGHPMTRRPNEIFSEAVCPAEPASASEHDWQKNTLVIFHNSEHGDKPQSLTKTRHTKKNANGADLKSLLIEKHSVSQVFSWVQQQAGNELTMSWSRGQLISRLWFLNGIRCWAHSCDSNTATLQPVPSFRSETTVNRPATFFVCWFAPSLLEKSLANVRGGGTGAP